MAKKVKIFSMMRRLPKDCVYDRINSPVGKLTLLASKIGLNALLWDYDWLSEEFEEIVKSLPNKPDHKYIAMTKQQLQEYFAGHRRSFDVPLLLDGTNFQKAVWNRLKLIPYGKTISYQEQAVSLGDKNKVRAVGSANGRNPISIIVPCHRVIAKDGSLHGFGGGLETKQFLINHEARYS